MATSPNGNAVTFPPARPVDAASLGSITYSQAVGNTSLCSFTIRVSHPQAPPPPQPPTHGCGCTESPSITASVWLLVLVCLALGRRHGARRAPQS